MKEIVIIGAGDFGKEVAWLIEEINKVRPTYMILGYLDDALDKIGKIINGYEVLGNVSRLLDLDKSHAVCAVIAMQDVDIRKRIVSSVPEFENWETLIHPSVSLSETSTLGKGCIVCGGTNISVNTEIGSHCLFNISATIGHDCVIGDYVSVMSGASICGHVQIQDMAYLATNCTVVPKMKIGCHAVVGAGSVAIRNVRDRASVMGVPARVIRF